MNEEFIVKIKRLHEFGQKIEWWNPDGYYMPIIGFCMCTEPDHQIFEPYYNEEFIVQGNGDRFPVEFWNEDPDDFYVVQRTRINESGEV